MAYKLIQLYADEEMHRKIQEAAKRAGMPVSTWIRVLALREIERNESGLLPTPPKHEKKRDRQIPTVRISNMAGHDPALL